MKAQAIYMVAKGKTEIRDKEVPDPSPDEAQVRCLANGICMAEVSLFTGVEALPTSRLVGHEGIGVVTKVGRNVKDLREGDRVVCGPWVTVRNYPAHALTKFPRPPADPTTALAEPAACVVGALYSYDITPGDRVLLIGAGFMGLLNVQGLAHYPLKELVVLDIKPKNLDLALAFGATARFQVGTPECDARLKAWANDPFDLAVEAAGAPDALTMGGPVTRPGGRLAIFAWRHQPRSVDLNLWHLRGLKILNSSPSICSSRAVDLLDRRTFDLSRLVTHRHHFSKVQEAMEIAADKPKGYVKGVLVFE